MSENKKIILSFDVEIWDETDWIKKYSTEKDLNDYFRESIEKILKFLEKNRGFATFFVTDTVVRKYPDIVKKISENGHEIGSHGIGHKRLPEKTHEDYRSQFISHINEIENITGKKVLGFRAPHFSLNEESAWIIDLLEEAGLKYDTSAFPVSMGEYGNKRFPTTKYRVKSNNIFLENENSKIMEFPVSIYKTIFGNIPFAGGIYFRLLPFFIFRYILNRKIKLGHVPIIYFHPHELESRTPRIKNGPWIKRKLKYFGVKQSFNKFEKLADYYSFDSLEKSILTK